MFSSAKLPTQVFHSQKMSQFAYLFKIKQFIMNIYVYIRSLLKNLHNNTNNISFPCVIYVLLSYFGESSKLSVMNNEYLPSPCSVSPSLCVKTNHCKDEKYKRKYKNKMMKKFSKFFSLSLLERLSRSVTIPIDYLTK